MFDRTRQRWRDLADTALLRGIRRLKRGGIRIVVAMRNAAWRVLIRQERRHSISRLAGRTVNLRDDAQVTRIVGLPWDVIYWKPVSVDQVVDHWSAARLCIDLWRGCSSLSEYFPRSQGVGEASFVPWLQQMLTNGIWPKNTKEHMYALLESNPAARARQYFLTNPVPRAELPEGLTPPGMGILLRWFMRRGMAQAGLRLEEVWWLFLQAADNPQGELAQAYLFTPAWQALHPDGLTIFGHDAFAAWFAAEQGVTAPWLDPRTWPEQAEPAIQLRTSYAARATWRQAHPDALTKPEAARAFLAWLASPQSGLPQAQRTWCAALDVEGVVHQLMMPGANVIAHFCYPSGLRVSAESLVQAMHAAGISSSLRDVRTDVRDEPWHAQFGGIECHDVTIIHVEPEPLFDRVYKHADLWKREPRPYCIAYWYWELDAFPDAWAARASQVDEVWTATKFIAESLRDKVSVPVHTLFPGVRLMPFTRRNRTYFGLKENIYIFLFTFHMVSIMERKNPIGLIRAFRQAFRTDEPVQLVLKTSFGDRYPIQLQELRDAAANADVTVIDQVYAAEEVLALMEVCDAYVSLHRSEGLGLTMAEAMLLGKPVIATHYSGNVDFMDESNSLLVPYELVTLNKSYPPYAAGSRWAQPSEAHAARLMRQIYENQDWARALGKHARMSALTRLSPETAGRRIRQRLNEISTMRCQTR